MSFPHKFREHLNQGVHVTGVYVTYVAQSEGGLGGQFAGVDDEALGLQPGIEIREIKITQVKGGDDV